MFKGRNSNRANRWNVCWRFERDDLHSLPNNKDCWKYYRGREETPAFFLLLIWNSGVNNSGNKLKNRASFNAYLVRSREILRPDA